MNLSAIASEDITDYMEGRLRGKYRSKGWKKAKQVKPATVNRDLAALKTIFREAVRMRRISSSPAMGIPTLKEDPNPPRLLTSGEICRLLDEMPDHLRAAVGCGVYAGLRRNEIMKLRWENIHLKNNVITVVSREGRSTKSNKDRKVPLSPVLAEMFRVHPRVIGSRWVFYTEGGHYEDIRKSLYAAARRAGIEKITMHQLRHAFISHGHMKGIDLRTLQGWVGHKDLKTTEKYAHTLPDHEKEAIKLIVHKDDEQASQNTAS